MAVIKIPSSNIYKVNTVHLAEDSKIERAEVSVESFLQSYGNVLSKEYGITYWVVVHDGEGENAPILRIPFVANDASYNEVAGTKITVPYSGAEYDLVQFPKWTFLIGQYATFDGDPYYSDIVDNECYVVRTKHYITVDASGTTQLSERTYTTKSGVGFVYDKDKVAFKCSLNTEKIDSTTGTIVKTKQADGTTEYLVSETITIESKYVTAESTKIEQGSESVNKFSLPSNELFQADNLLIQAPDMEDLTVAAFHDLFEDKMLPNVLKRYKYGKEVYGIRCSVAEYYNTNGALAISPQDSTLPMAFKLHELVEPYVFTTKGEVPLSTKSDGTPKQFEIIGIDYSYKGVVWQELTIQEYIE